MGGDTQHSPSVCTGVVPVELTPSAVVVVDSPHIRVRGTTAVPQEIVQVLAESRWRGFE